MRRLCILALAFASPAVARVPASVALVRFPDGSMLRAADLAEDEVSHQRERTERAAVTGGVCARAATVRPFRALLLTRTDGRVRWRWRAGWPMQVAAQPGRDCVSPDGRYLLIRPATGDAIGHDEVLVRLSAPRAVVTVRDAGRTRVLGQGGVSFGGWRGATPLLEDAQGTVPGVIAAARP